MGSRITCRDLNEKYTSLHEKLDIIREKVEVTNGRVKKLEIWRNYITGGLTVLCIIVVPILLLIISHNLKL